MMIISKPSTPSNFQQDLITTSLVTINRPLVESHTIFGCEGHFLDFGIAGVHFEKKLDWLRSTFEDYEKICFYFFPMCGVGSVFRVYAHWMLLFIVISLGIVLVYCVFGVAMHKYI
jgi:hypothetical protein